MSKDKRFKRDNRGRKSNKPIKGKGICPDGYGGYYSEHTFSDDGYCEVCGYFLK